MEAGRLQKFRTIAKSKSALNVRKAWGVHSPALVLSPFPFEVWRQFLLGSVFLTSSKISSHSFRVQMSSVAFLLCGSLKFQSELIHFKPTEEKYPD